MQNFEFDLSSFLPQRPEKILQKNFRLVLHKTALHLEAVIQTVVPGNVIKALTRAGLAVERAVNQPFTFIQHQRARAHRARLERHVHCRAFQGTAVVLSVLGKKRRGLRHCDHLRVRRGVAEHFRLIVRPRDDLIFINHHRAHRDLAFPQGKLGLLERFAHEIIFHGMDYKMKPCARMI